MKKCIFNTKGYVWFSFIILLLSVCTNIESKNNNKNNKFYLLNDIVPDGNKISIVTTGPIEYSVFKIPSPPRLVIELTNIEHNAPNKKDISVGGEIIKTVRSAQFQDEPVKIVRVVVDLERMVEYAVVKKDNEIIVSLGEGEAKAEPEVKPAPVAVPEVK